MKLRLALVSGLALVATVAVPAQSLGERLAPEYVLRDLPAAVGRFYLPSTLAAFLFLCIGLVAAMIQANSTADNLKAVVKACILAGVIALLPQIVPWFVDTANNTAGDLSESGTTTAGKIVDTALTTAAKAFFPGMDNTINAAQEAEQASWWKVPFIYAKGLAKDAWEAQIAQLKMTSALPEAMVRIVMAVVYLGATLACYLIQYFVGLARYFLLYAEIALMPVFIAGLGTQFFRHQATTYISSWFGILLWPLGWGLWDLGTLSICDAIASFVDTGAQAILPANASMAQIVGVRALSMVTGASTLTLVMLVLLSVFLFVWVLTGAVAAPFLIQKAFTAGSHFFVGALAQGGGAAVGAVGTALSKGGEAVKMVSKAAAPATGGASLAAMPVGSAMSGASNGAQKMSQQFGDADSSGRGGGGGGGQTTTVVRQNAAKAAARSASAPPVMMS